MNVAHVLGCLWWLLCSPCCLCRLLAWPQLWPQTWGVPCGSGWSSHKKAAKVQPTQPAQPSDHSCSSYSLKGATYVIKSYEVKHQVFSNSEVCHGMSDSCVEFNAGLPAMIRAMSYLLSVLLPIFCQVPKWMLQRRLQVVQIMRRATKRERNISTWISSKACLYSILVMLFIIVHLTISDLTGGRPESKTTEGRARTTTENVALQDTKIPRFLSRYFSSFS